MRQYVRNRLDPGTVRTTELSRGLRKSQTDAETLLWSRLRGRQLGGAKFRRQQAIGPYVIDFYCHERRIAVEVDGGQHYEPDGVQRDAERTAALNSVGLRILRFSNLEVLQQLDAVLESIWNAIDGSPPHPSPLPPGRGDKTPVEE